MSYNEQVSDSQELDLQQCIYFFNEEKFTEAIILGEALAQKLSTVPMVYEILAAANLSLGNDGETIKYYRKLLRLNPNHADAYNNLGKIYYEKGNFLKAIENYQEAVKAEPSFADAHYNLANSLKQIGKLKEAFHSYQASLEINPKDTEVLTIYGDALRDFGKFEKAIECYTKILKIAPNLAQIQSSLAITSKEKVEIGTLLDKFLKDTQSALDSKEAINFCGTIL
ncbi:tetratricopeptide repeat protein, partial [Rhodobacteraceae bacterium]|nr:tetratricopeptide repeat protein [Paracoccaceae bacterium]